jgi:hypothetical protein
MKRSTFRLALVDAFLAGMAASMETPSDVEVQEALEQDNPGLPLMRRANRFSTLELSKHAQDLEEG